MNERLQGLEQQQFQNYWPSNFTMLKIIDLTKEYRTGAKALKGVSFEVDLPQVVTIIGPSGAGKSTLIRCINRLIDPTSGQIMRILVAGSCPDPFVGLWRGHCQ
jgi:ABC-type multidrug transport system fused ATPase/permease subunit